MKVLITGGTGFIGLSLVRRLSKRNHEIIVLTRDVAKASKLMGVLPNVEFCSILDQIPSSTKIDHIVNLAGARVPYLPWTKGRREKLINSRLSITDQIINLVKRLKTKPDRLINASAISWYGYSNLASPIDESYMQYGDSFGHDLCEVWEKRALEVKQFGVDVKIMRFGLVIGKDGGLLDLFNPVFKYGFGFYLGSGNQYTSWIHKSDLIEACVFLMKNATKNSIFNFTAPNPVTNKEFCSEIGKCLHRPVWLKIPRSLICLLAGDLGREIILSDVYAIPQNLLDEGFKFHYPDIASAMTEIYG